MTSYRQFRHDLRNYPVNQDCAMKFSRSIDGLYGFYKEKQWEKQRKMEFFDTFKEIMNDRKMEKALNEEELSIDSIRIYGSSNTKMAKKSSDLDIILHMFQTKYNDDNQRTSETRAMQLILREVRRNLKVLPNMTNAKVQYIPRMTPELIKLSSDSLNVDITCDFSFFAPPAYIGSKLISVYEIVDSRFSELTVYITSLFNKVINSEPQNKAKAEKIFPSSYAVKLMIIHFLQVYRLLPNLREYNDFDTDVADRYDMDKWEDEGMLSGFSGNSIWKHQELGEVFYTFFVYYGHIRDLTCEEIHIENCVIRQKPQRNNKLKIVDDYDPNNPGRRVTDVETFIDYCKEVVAKIQRISPRNVSRRVWKMQLDFSKIQQAREDRKNNNGKSHSVCKYRS